MTTMHFYRDPSHGWLQVAREALTREGMKLSDFSSYSYVGKACIYLEEDCDAPKFLQRFADNHAGEKPTIKEHFSDRPSSIRNYSRNIA